MNEVDIAKNPSPPPGSSGAPPQGQRRSWDLAQLSALAAVIGAITSMTYVLGLYVLWMPLAREYTHDVATSLYSVTIVPKTVVISHGLSRIWIPTLLLTLIYGAYFVPDEILSSKGRKAFRRILYAVFIVLGVYGWWLIFDQIRHEGFSSFKGEFSSSFSSSDLVLIGVIYLVSIFVFTFAFAKLRKYLRLSLKSRNRNDTSDESADKGNGNTELSTPTHAQRTNALHNGTSPSPTPQLPLLGRLMRTFEDLELPHIISRINLLKAIGTLFAMSFLLTTMFVLLSSQPPVPRAEIDRSENASNVEGDLLAHSEGFWYVADQEKGEILAIPDSEVETVRVFPEHD